ncbi:hypothetical protein [Rathayibacter caricis]|uniref:hypothetical protein n=1 Tax=Rathayibacter caricis TaxID=110936 RepID=UPI000D1F5C5F|nr:hypothetical protein [Rathayibacter caricis]MCJ1697308.1 hypothetical protein [Rathayibacter caricis]
MNGRGRRDPVPGALLIIGLVCIVVAFFSVYASGRRGWRDVCVEDFPYRGPTGDVVSGGWSWWPLGVRCEHRGANSGDLLFVEHTGWDLTALALLGLAAVVTWFAVTVRRPS